MGGWISDLKSPAKDQVWRFHFQVTKKQFPWAFKEGDPQKRIAAIELLGTLVLCQLLLTQQKSGSSSVRLPILEATTKAMSFPSLASHPRNRTPQLFWWNSFGSCIWRAALWPRAMFLANSTNGQMSSHTSTTVASLTSSASMWERPCLTSFSFPD